MSYLPLLLVVLSVATFVTTYIIAIVKGDVAVYFPYISDTGTTSPESCIFSQFLNICAALALGTIYVRYKLALALGGLEDPKLRRLNFVGLILGVFTSLGLSLVANFQETNLEPVHVTGAFLVFGVGVIYAFIQTALSYHMYPDFNGLYICRCRLALSTCSLLAMVVTSTGAAISRMQKKADTDRLHWKPEDPGFAAHIVSTIGEWVTAIVFLCYFLTFVRDFTKLRLDVHPQLHVRHLDEEPVYPTERTHLLS